MNFVRVYPTAQPSPREYSMLISRPGGYMNWPGHTLKSRWRIRTVAIAMFRKWFGREPKILWHKDGFMCEARDERGNTLELQQTNWGHPKFKPVHIQKGATK